MRMTIGSRRRRWNGIQRMWRIRFVLTGEESRTLRLTIEATLEDRRQLRTPLPPLAPVPVQTE